MPPSHSALRRRDTPWCDQHTGDTEAASVEQLPTVRGSGCSVAQNGDVRHRPARPRFSIVLPVRDRADVIGRTVAGVLSQTFADLELLVVDRGSEDGSMDAVRAAGDERVVVIDGPVDPAAAYVAGLEAATGAWTALIDADCEVTSGWLARLGRLVDATDAGFVSCGGIQHDGRGGTIELRPTSSGAGANACVRAGAFLTTTDRLRTVVEIIGSELTGSVDWDRPDDTTCVDDDGCSGHLGRAALDLTLLDGDAAVSSPELLVAWHERPDGRVEPAPLPNLDEIHLRVAFQGLDALARTPIPDGDLLARYATAGGVAAARLRQGRDARRLFRIACRARPEVRDHWSNLVAAHLGPLGQRAWVER